MFISEDDAWMHVQGQEDEFSGIGTIIAPDYIDLASCAEQGCEIKKSSLLKLLRSQTCRERIK